MMPRGLLQAGCWGTPPWNACRGCAGLGPEGRVRNQLSSLQNALGQQATCWPPGQAASLPRACTGQRKMALGLQKHSLGLRLGR